MTPLKTWGLIVLALSALGLAVSVLTFARAEAADVLAWLPLWAAVVLGVALGLVALTRQTLGARLRPQAQLLKTVAVRFEGEVRENLLLQLHLPHPLCAMRVDLYLELDALSGPPPRWTRVTLSSPGFALPRFKLSLANGAAAAAPRHPAAAAPLDALRALSRERLRVRTQRRSALTGQAVTVWLAGWPASADELSRCIHEVAPHLVELAEALRR